MEQGLPKFRIPLSLDSSNLAFTCFGNTKLLIIFDYFHEYSVEWHLGRGHFPQYFNMILSRLEESSIYRPLGELMLRLIRSATGW